jgi:predicted nucleic acid-binding protein
LIVVDASLMTAWLLNEPALTAGFDANEIFSDSRVSVPSHWPIEISNALRTNLTGGRLGPVDFHAIVERLDLLNVRVEPAIELDEIISLAQFAAAHDLTAYDAAYIQLALSRRCALATLDNAMRRVATKLGVNLLPD